MKLVLGIDPGLSGACALLGDDFATIFDLPSKTDDATGRRIDPVLLANLVQEKIPPGARVQVCIEALANGGFGGKDKESRTNAFTVGSQFWTQSAIVNTLELLGLQVNAYVQPVKWKAMFGIKGKASEDAAATKRRTREIAVSLYPSLAELLQRQADHNRADACLIAHYFRKVRQ